MADLIDQERSGSEVVAPTVEFRGLARELLPVVLVNTLLNIVTVTLYRFWARTRIRRYLWSEVYILDDALEYTGTGRELFLGFLVILGAVFLPLGAVGYAIAILGQTSPEGALLTTLLYIVLLFLYGAAIYRARRFRFSRTSWRGIRFGQSGSWVAYAAKFFGFSLLLLVTLGWSYPWQLMRLTHQELNNSWIGNRRFSFDGHAGSIYGRFAAVWFGAFFLVFPALFVIFGFLAAIVGAVWPDMAEDVASSPVAALIVAGIFVYFPGFLIYRLLASFFYAGFLRRMFDSLRLENLGFALNMSTAGYVGLELVNFLIVVFTIGFGLPFAQLRRFRYLLNRIQVGGEIDLAAIGQHIDEGPRFGEGLADAFDLGAV